MAKVSSYSAQGGPAPKPVVTPLPGSRMTGGIKGGQPSGGRHAPGARGYSSKSPMGDKNAKDNLPNHPGTGKNGSQVPQREPALNVKTGEVAFTGNVGSRGWQEDHNDRVAHAKHPMGTEHHNHPSGWVQEHHPGYRTVAVELGRHHGKESSTYGAPDKSHTVSAQMEKSGDPDAGGPLRVSTEPYKNADPDGPGPLKAGGR